MEICVQPVRYGWGDRLLSHGLKLSHGLNLCLRNKSFLYLRWVIHDILFCSKTDKEPSVFFQIPSRTAPARLILIYYTPKIEQIIKKISRTKKLAIEFYVSIIRKNMK
jgi:hypothetical protein